MYSPTRNGLVKMIESPANRLLSSPCMASAMPAPATPSPAMSGSSSTPRFWIAMITNSSETTTRAMRTIRLRTGGSISRCISARSSQRDTWRPTR